MSKKKLVAMLVVKDEERYLPDTLEHASRYVDEIVILDDGSTDRTSEICHSFPKLVSYERQELPFHEGRSRKRLLAMALARSSDWLLALDADEVFEDRMLGVVETLMNPPDSTIAAYWFPIFHFWNSQTRFRVDPPWGDQMRAKLIKVEPGMRLSTAQFHVANMPVTYAPQRARIAPIRLKHYGYVDSAVRQRRYAFYEREDRVKDPAMIGRADYRHLVDETGLQLKEWREDDAAQTNLPDPAVARAQDDRDTHPLVSIVIPVCNGRELTMRCLASLEANRAGSQEIIVVDNGSTDDPLDEISHDTRIIRNPTNRGFPTACNQGIRAARGEYVVLLNNDTLVTPGWLDRLVGAAQRQPDIGLVGPLTNYAGGAQQIEPLRLSVDGQTVEEGHYTTAEGLNLFAAFIARQNAGKMAETRFLSGFCLLLKRSTIGRVGLLEEMFGLGNFEDNDYCMRAMGSGLKLAIALDCFVHHEGSATFRALGIDYQKLMRENGEKFARKWGLSESRRRPVGLS